MSGCVYTKIGQCQRYSEYERLPIHVISRRPSTWTPSTVPGCTVAAIATHEATETMANPPRYRNVSVDRITAKQATSTPMAPNPARSRATVFTSASRRHWWVGFHTSASAAPSSRPAARVSVP